RPHERDQFAAVDVDGDAGQYMARAAVQVHVAHTQDGGAHDVDAFQRRSRRRASVDSGSDITRYKPAQRTPGMTQLPRFVAKICVCLVNSRTVNTDTSEESLSSATKS